MGLLEMSISGAVFIMAVAAVRAVLLNRLPKKTFLLLWFVVVLHLLLPFRIPSKISLYTWMPQISAVNAKIESGPAQAQEADNESEINRKPGTESTEQVNLNGLNAGDIEKKSRQADEEARNHQNITGRYGQAQGGLNQAGLDQDVSDNDFLDTFIIQKLYGRLGYRGVLILEIVWAGGCILCLLFFLLTYINIRFNFSASVPVENEFCLHFMNNHRGRRPVQVRQSGFVKAPLTYGLLHPVILMPENTDWENTRQLEYVFMHEYTHIKRFDLIVKLMLIVALSVHWFNPFVWMMYILCNRDLELSCDEAVVYAFGESAKSDYARVLIDMEEQKKKLMPLCNSFSKNAMEERIVAIMKIKKRTVSAAAAAAVLTCIVSGIFATSAAAGVQQGVSRQTGAESSPNNADSTAEAQAGSKYSSAGQNAGIGVKDASSGQAAGVKGASSGQAAGADGGDGKSVSKAEGIKITNVSLNLSNEQARMISNEVFEHMETKYKGIYEFSNYSVRFCNEAVNGETLSLDIDVSVNMMLIRNPKKSPFVRGMREAVKEVRGAKKRKAARKLYKDYLKDIMPYYMRPDPDTTGFSYLVQIPVSSVQNGSDAFSFELFYRSNIDGEILGSFADEAVFTDGFTKADGKNYIKENL